MDQKNPILIRQRLVPDPLISDAEIIHRRARNPHDRHIGKVLAATNMVTLIGALAFVRRRLSHHEKAAEWFKNAYESGYGGMPAIDLNKIRVDFAALHHDDAAASRLDRGRALRAVLTELGPEATGRLIACTVLNIPCAHSAPPAKSSGKPSGRAIERVVDRLLEALDRVAEMRGFIATRGHSDRAGRVI